MVKVKTSLNYSKIVIGANSEIVAYDTRYSFKSNIYKNNHMHKQIYKNKS